MKNLILIFICFFSLQLLGQEGFEFSEKGLTPKFKEIQIKSKSDSLLFTNAVEWVENNEETFNLKLIKKVSNERIEFSSVKNNGTSLDKQYYHVKYGIELLFEKETIKFVPKSIHLKLNSKYDMGWNDFDLNDGKPYIRKSKIDKKYKKYLNAISSQLNAVVKELGSFLSEN